MGQTARNLYQELAEIEQKIAASDNYREITDLNIEALKLRRELGLPLDN